MCRGTTEFKIPTNGKLKQGRPRTRNYHPITGIPIRPQRNYAPNRDEFELNYVSNDSPLSSTDFITVYGDLPTYPGYVNGPQMYTSHDGANIFNGLPQFEGDPHGMNMNDKYNKP